MLILQLLYQVFLLSQYIPLRIDIAPVTVIAMPEHCLFTLFWQLKGLNLLQRFFIHSPYGNLTDAIFDFETSSLEHKTLVFSTFTVSPLLFHLFQFFHFPSFPIL